jgi:two-component system, LytTR family, response regulator LytT
METMKILIIEDEPHAQKELKRLLEVAEGKFEILDMIDTVEDSVEWLQNNPPPDLIFLDIQLADGISFDIFRKTEVKSPVIFTTAYDDYAIRAFQLNSIDYLLKPIKLTDLMRAVNKYESIKSQYEKGGNESVNITKNQLESLLNLSKKEYKSRFIAKVGDQIKYIPVEEIAYFYAEDNVVFLMKKSADRFIIDYSIEEIDSLVDPKNFFRLNRSIVAHINAIDKVYKYLNSRLKVELKPEIDKEVLISRVKVSEFMKWMDR